MYGLDFPEAPKTYKQLPEYCICISAREDTRKLWQVDISVIRSTPFWTGDPGLSFSPGYHRRWGPLGHCSSFDPAIDNPSGPRKVGKNRSKMTTGWGGWFLEPINSPTIVTNTGKFTLNKPLTSSFFGKNNLVNSSTRKDWFIPFISLFHCLGP